jgi:tyrosine decarboxylase/aspartate 1-decarboxylase
MREGTTLIDGNDLPVLLAALKRLERGFAHLPPFRAGKPESGLEPVLFELADKLQNNFPYFHPLYAGQMLKPPHRVARMAYHLAMWINPNNHALDGGRATSTLEKEAVAELAGMFGWRTHLGHLNSGGTMANLEALWIAGKLHPRKWILASSQAHYTHQRISGVLRLPFAAIEAGPDGRMDLNRLERRLKRGRVGTVVVTMGTTAAGSVDDLPAILDLQKRFGFRVHADAAYGGYFVLASNLSPRVRNAMDALRRVDSLVIDPHKHGLQPYGCGCVLFRDPAVGRFYKHDSPYTYFSSRALHLGEISLECSRPGAAAAALWATQRLLPLIRGGEFARSLERCRDAALALHGRLNDDSRFIPARILDLDIVNWISGARTLKQASESSVRIYREAAKLGLHLALAELPAKFFPLKKTNRDQTTVTCLRSVLMKPEHHDWIERIWDIIDQSAASFES